MGFAGSKRETKHHLWKFILIDCCSLFSQRSFRTLLRAGDREEEGEVKPGERKRCEAHRSELSKASESLCSSAAQECAEQALKKIYKYKKIDKSKTIFFLFFVTHLLFQHSSQNVHFAWSLNWVMRLLMHFLELIKGQAFHLGRKFVRLCSALHTKALKACWEISTCTKTSFLIFLFCSFGFLFIFLIQKHKDFSFRWSAFGSVTTVLMTLTPVWGNTGVSHELPRLKTVLWGNWTKMITIIFFYGCNWS